MSRVRWREGAVASLLRRHGLLDADWHALQHNGYSGASLLVGRAGSGASWVLKRSCLQDDWIMEATSDVRGRECELARAGILRSGRVRSAAVDGARVGRHAYTLMTDISEFMVNGPVGRGATESIVAGLVDLHARPFGGAGDFWCTLDDRLLLLTRGIGALRASRDSHGLADQVRAGWELFAEQAPRRLTDLIRAAAEDTGSLAAALAPLPWTSLHGDLKLDNIGLAADGTLWLIDWALAVRGPVCVELGWFIAANSLRLAASPQEIVDLYASAARLEGNLRHRHQAMTAFCGLLLRGWRKALDARSDDRHSAEFAWWCESAAEAERFLA